MSGNEGGKYHEVAKALSKLLFQKGLNIEVMPKIKIKSKLSKGIF